MHGYLVSIYTITFLLYIACFLCRLLKWRYAEQPIALTALVANVCTLTFATITFKHLPLFSLFESLVLAAFILGLLGIVFTKPEEQVPDVRMWVWSEIILLLGITLFFEKAPARYYDHNYLFNCLFHGLRVVALGVTLFSSAYYLQYWVNQKRNMPAGYLSHQGRNFLLLGSIFFLTAEYMGIIWCQNGWGDFWMWSAGFLQSTFIVLYFMLAFHIPGRSAQSERIRSLIGGMTAFVMLGLIMVRGLPV